MQIAPGDLVHSINTLDACSMSLVEFQEHILGEPGSEITLGVSTPKIKQLPELLDLT